MKQIENLVTEFNSLKEQTDKQIGFFAYNNYPIELKEFYDKLNEINKSLKGYGYPISIKTNIISGLAKSSKCIITLTHYNEEGLEILVSLKDKKKDPIDIVYTVNPIATTEFTETKNENIEKTKVYYLPITSFVFLQLYDKLDSLVKESKKVAISEIKKKIDFQNKLYNLDRKLKEAD